MSRIGLALLVATLAAATPAGAAVPPAFAERVVAEATEAAKASVAPPDRFEVLGARFGGADPLPAGAIGLELAQVSKPNAAGLVSVRFRMLAGGQSAGEARATVRGIVRGPALRALRVLERDRPLGVEDVEVADCDLTRLGGAPLREPSEAAGRVPVRTLGGERVLTAALLAEAPLVRRGETVELALAAPGFAVRTRGTALRDGCRGEVVPVENAITGVALLARVEADGTLRVVGRPAERAR